MRNHLDVRRHIIPKLCAITLPDDPLLLTNIETALKCGVKWIQYREKNKVRRQLYLNAQKIIEITTKYNALLTINDYLDVAIVIGARSIHLGQDDMPCHKAREITSKDVIIGVSTHNIDEAMEAESNGADYIGFGSIFMTDTKEIGEPKGVDLLKIILKNVNIPVVAIGGINTSNIYQLLDGGSPLCSVAMSSGIFKGNIEKNCNTFSKLNLL